MTTPTDPQRLKVSAQAVGTDNPQLAYTLANSGLTSAQIQAVGGFASALQTNTTGQLVADSGVTPNYTTQEQNHADALGVQLPGQKAPAQDDHLNWFEKSLMWAGSHIADGGNFIFHNPVTHGIMTGLDWINNAAHMPWRLLSEGVSHDTTAENEQMQEQGYDPNSGLSKFWFLWNHGDAEFHNLDNLRATKGDHLVDLAVQQLSDPQGFQQQFENMDPSAAAQLKQTINSDDFKETLAAVDAQHISPGRDIAGVLFAPFGAKTENNELFKLLSGALDATYTWMADPTLLAGKVGTAVKAVDVLGRVNEDANLTTRILTRMAANAPDGLLASRARGLQDANDVEGIYKALGVAEVGDGTLKVVEDTAAGKGLDQFIERLKALREAQAKADDAKLPEAERQAAQTEAAQLYAQIDTAHRAVMPWMPEFNGLRVIGPAKPKFNPGLVQSGKAQHLDEMLAEHTDDSRYVYRTVSKDDYDRMRESGVLDTDGRYNATEQGAAMLGSTEPHGPLQYGAPGKDSVLLKIERRPEDGWRPDDYDGNPAYVATENDELPFSRVKAASPFRQMNREKRNDPVASDPASITPPPGGNDIAPTYDATINSRLSGGWEAVKGKPIEDRAEAARYIASSGALLRLANGEAAHTTMLMPGKVSWWAERMAVRKANSAEKWINYLSDKYSKMLPTEAENDALTQLDQAGGDENLRARLGDVQHNLLRTGTADGQGFNPFVRFRARMERFNRRITTVLPMVKEFDLTDPSTVKDVERFARFYLNKGDARILAARYATGDLNDRRAVVRGMLTQSFHAAGLYRTPAGTKFADGYLRDIDQQMYGLADTDLINTDRGLVHGAIYNSQLSTKVPMPALKQLNQLAVRFAVDSWAAKMGATAAMGAIQSNRMDALYGHVKMGWITSVAGGFRNAADELAGFMAKGMFSQWVKGRVAYSAAMTEAREARREASLAWMAKAKAEGRDAANEWAIRQNYVADQGVEAAQRAVEQAVRARLELENVEATAAAPLERARDKVRTAQQAERDARERLQTVKASGDETALDQLAEAHVTAIEARQKAEKDWFAIQGQADRGKLPTVDEVRQQILDRHARDGVLGIDDAEANLKAALKERENARALENVIHHKVPYFLRRGADTVSDVLASATFGKMLRVMGPRWAPSADEVNYARELRNEELRSILRDGVQQTHFADLYGAIAGPEGAMQMHRDGLMARPYSFRPAGWGTVEPDGGQGLDSFAKYLALRFADPTEASHEWLRAYKDYGDLRAARDAVRAHLDDPAMRHFLANAEVMRTLRDGRKVTAETLAEAKDELADRISADLTHGLLRDGKINDNLLDQLLQAKQIGTPDASWISHNVPVGERPEQTIGQLWAVYNPQHGPGRIPRGYMQMMTKSYEKVVTDQIDALSRNPLLTALYINARKNVQPWERHLVESGWDPESAREVAMRMSLMHAEQEAYKHVDNPWVASQFSLISRNFLNFERAQEDWLRRWARTLRDNPTIIRKAQLALHAGTASGMLDQDPQTGELNFIYPGSQLAMRVFNSVMQGVGLGNVVKIPVVQELTSRIEMLSPSLQQPFGVTASPLLVLPFKAISSTVGQDHQLLMQTIDEAMNGTLGAGRSWYEQILPPTINRILRGVVMSDPGSQYGQAYTNATMALAASGHFEGLDGTDPTKISNTQDKIAAQTRNNMVLNTLFGFFAPAAPMAEFNTDNTNAKGFQGNTPDWSAHIAGYRTLKAEAQKALADLGPTRFRLWWAAVHPHELIWDPTAGVGSHTKAGANNAYLPATLNAAKWGEDSPEFLAKYGGAGGIGAYLIPSYQNILGYDDKGNPIIGPSDPSQQFNEVAYRAQLQDHLREEKPLSELLPDIIIQRGEAEYYGRKDVYDAQIADATAAGNSWQAKQLEDQWSKEKRDIYARNPLLAQKNASFATNGAVQQVALDQLHRLVDDHSAATTKAIGPLRQGVQFLLQAYDDYQAAEKALAGRRGGFATAQRSRNLENYQAGVQSVAQQFPDLADLVRGVFRTP